MWQRWSTSARYADMLIRIFDTPDAREQNLPFEQFKVLDESAEGILVEIGEDHYAMLPWEYVARYGYRIIR